MHTGVPIPPDPMEQLEKNRIIAEHQQLTKKERRKLKKLQKHEEEKTRRRGRTAKKTAIIITVVLAGIGVISFIIWLASNQPLLPPTTMQGHIEQSPSSHILDQPMPENIQKHMLEHADGKDKPGIIIQYNCDDFDCDTGLIKKLTEIVEEYDNVYLAPNNYDGKIILTKLDKREILDTFDEQEIKDFIGVLNEGPYEQIRVSMVSGNLFFNPKSLTLIKGKSATITFQNKGTHTFTIDELGVNAVLSGNSATVEFIPTKSGTFEYYCSVPGHREGGMFGSLSVE